MGEEPSGGRDTIPIEERIGVRLLARTTRSVTPTEAGKRLLANVAPRLEVLTAVLADWMPHLRGLHLYYLNRQHPAAFQRFVDGIRYRA